jgi:hypothetical protein
MSECFYLTANELADMQADGWTLVNGPHATEADCIAACGGSGDSGSSGGSGSDCPCQPLPTDVIATIVTSTDPCIEGLFCTLTDTGGGIQWTGFLPYSGGPTCTESTSYWYVNLTCSSSAYYTGLQWVLSLSNTPGGGTVHECFPMDVVSCDPLHLQCDMTIGGASTTWIITE